MVLALFSANVVPCVSPQAQLDYDSVCRRRRHLHQETAPTSPLATETNRDVAKALDNNCNATLPAVRDGDLNAQLQGMVTAEISETICSPALFESYCVKCK